MTHRASLHHLTLLAILAAPMFVAARCDNALSIGQEDMKGDAGGANEAPEGAPCKRDECTGPAPKSATYTCADGSIAGPECTRDAAGRCAWSERACPVTNPSYQCSDGVKLAVTQLCDGVKDCPEGSDEANCGSSDGSIFVCATLGSDGSKITLPNELLCNGKKECPDGSDEADCGSSDGGIFVCATLGSDGGTIALPKELLCNGKKECPDGSDEADCAADASDLFACSTPAADGTKITLWKELRCNGKVECPDGSDETNCGGGSFVCASDTTIVLPKEALCNGKKECADGSDEGACNGVFYCADGSNVFLAPTLLCNGKPECPSGKDEVNCTSDGQNCPAGIEKARSYDAENGCLTAPTLVCYELTAPELSVPKDWPATTCARRLGDGALFVVSSPKSIQLWGECTPEEATAVDDAVSCGQ